MDVDYQRLWFKFQALLNGYRAYYSSVYTHLQSTKLDPDETELLNQNLKLYEQYLRRLETMQISLVSREQQERPKSLIDKPPRPQPTYSSMDAELDGMVGRLRVEVQAIVGFARLGQGDTFELHLKHGQQKWRCRGKTQADRTQKWDCNQHLFTCYPDQPLIVKVLECRLLRSKVLSERQFEVARFFAPQPLLVTMNLNAIGSLKLKMVVAWLPLMTSKTLPASTEEAQNMQLGSPAQYHTTGINTNLLSASTMSMPAPLTNGYDGNVNLNRSTMTLQSTLTRDSTRTAISPPRVNLREKKRQSKSTGPNNKTEQQAWRSSTALLDAAYKDLSKSIPTIDDLTAFGAPQHRAMRSDCINSSMLPQQANGRPSQPLMGLKASQSLHHLASNDGRNSSDATNHPLPAHRSSVYCNTGDFKSSGETKVSPVVDVNGVQVEMRNRKSADSDDSSGVSSLGATGSMGRRSVHATCEKVDSLLQLIDRLRSSLTPLRAEEYAEVSAFEAAMLSWEAALKLNRALFVENTRTMSSQRSHPNRLQKRASLYSVQQPSPPSTLSSEDSNERHVGTGEHIFESDSGIDSLRQPISPYNRQRQFMPANAQMYMNGSLNGRFTNGQQPMGPAQRRFNKHIQERRRRSLGGWILDDPIECERWLNSLQIGTEQRGNSGKVSIQVATGHPELDLCLQHHLSGALVELEELAQSRGPLEYRTNELLNRVEQQTVALEEMLRIADALPAWPNVTNLLSDLGADWDQQELWLATCYAQNASIIVPAERLRINLHSATAPVVQKAQYPQLVARVVDTLMSNLQHADELQQPNQFVSVFEFGALFAGKQFATYVESVAHEAFITSSLESQQPSAIREIMERLRQVPIVPPMESLRHIGIALQSSESPEVVASIERYLRSASNDLQQDLSLSFIHLLESNCPRSRRGACRALLILRSEDALDKLEFVSTEDKDKSVSDAAKKAYDQIQHFFDEYQEITKI